MPLNRLPDRNAELEIMNLIKWSHREHFDEVTAALRQVLIELELRAAQILAARAAGRADSTPRLPQPEKTP